MNTFINKVKFIKQSSFKKLIYKNLEILFQKYIYFTNFDFKKFNQNKLVVFMYHEVSNYPSPYQEKYFLNVSIDNFEKQIG